MPRFLLKVSAFTALASLLLYGIASTAPARNYRMYRNPPKPRLAVLPVAGRGLEPSLREAFDKALARDARRLKTFQAVPLPPEVAVDSLGQLPPGGLAALRERFKVDLALQTLLDSTDGRLILYAEIIDTRTGDIRGDLKEECRCGRDELIGARLPTILDRLAAAPRLKAMRCQEGMAAVPVPVSPGAPEPDSAGGGWGPGAFCIDLFEFPNRSSGEPVVEKTWEQAQATCAKSGKRLCTEGEWELACAGFRQEAYPYGASYDEPACNTKSQTIQLSGGNAGCRSAFGVYDLSGNVYEWTSSDWSSKYDHKVVKGGNWSSGAENSTCKARFGQPPATVSKAIGFRCCLGLSR